MSTRRDTLLHLLRGTAGLASAGVWPAALATVPAVPQRVIFVINGTLGDKSFFDMGAAGMQAIKAKYGAGVETKVLEMGTERSRWQATLDDVADRDWDLIVACTYEMGEMVSDVADSHPDKNFVLFDGVVSYAKGANRNINSIAYKQNEAAYLAGMLAAGLIRDGVVTASQGGQLGFLGGMDIPIINDFLVGYAAGARAVTPGIRMQVAYAGNFSDAAKGKELALAQFRSGVGIGLQVAGQTGLGLLAAAKDSGKYAIGANSDQASLFLASDPALAARIVTSVLKRVDTTLLRAYALQRAGQLPLGKLEALGLAENAVGLVETGNMARLCPPALKKQIDEARLAVISGKLKVPTGFGMSSAALAQLRASLRPA